MNKLRTEIRRQIKKILLEQYASGDIVIGGNPSDFFGGSNYAYDYGFEQEETNTRVPGRAPNSNANNQQSYPEVSEPRIPPGKGQAPLPGSNPYEDKQVSNNHIQFKEGYEVYRINEKKIGIKNLRTDIENNYKINYLSGPLTITKIEMTNSSANLTASKAGVEKTVVLTDLNKQAIMTGFENNKQTFKVKGTTTEGETGTVKFIKGT